MSNAIENALAIAAKRTNTSPTEAQKAADSYAKGKVQIHGLPVNIENPKGSERSGVDKGGKRWSVKMPAHYGEVHGTEGKDGDPVDVYIGPDHASKTVFVVDQVDAKTGKFDEHKAMLSYGSKADALADYRKAFSDGKANDRIGAVTAMTVADFRTWLKSGNTKKPLADSSKSGRDTHMARDTKSTADAALAVARRFATGGAVRGYADGGMTGLDGFVPEPPISEGDDGVKSSIAAYRPELAIGPASKPAMPSAPLPQPSATEYVYVTKHPAGHKQHRAADGKFRSDPKVEIARRAGGAVTRPSFDAKAALGKASIAKADGGEVKRKDANDFGPLTPEQQANLDRDKINESLGPFDWMPGPQAALYGGGGALMGALLPGGLTSIRHMMRLGYPRSHSIASGLEQTAVVGGGTGVMGYANDLKDRYFDRADRENKMMFGDPRDAEGQPGYGPGPATKSALDAAKKYATGGAVHVGPVMGATGGRSDELPVSVPSGSFVVPADVVSSLGEGNTAAGMEKLRAQYPQSGAPNGRASGGSVPVPIKISDGEFVISPEDVAAIGGGDMAKGHKMLDAMMVKLRKDHIKTLAALPPPSK